MGGSGGNVSQSGCGMIQQSVLLSGRCLEAQRLHMITNTHTHTSSSIRPSQTDFLYLRLCSLRSFLPATWFQVCVCHHSSYGEARRRDAVVWEDLSGIHLKSFTSLFPFCSFPLLLQNLTFLIPSSSSLFRLPLLFLLILFESNDI